VGELECDITSVISNHDDLRSMVEWHGIPFHHVPVDPQNKVPAFNKVAQLIDDQQADLRGVGALYANNLPPELCRRFANRG